MRKQLSFLAVMLLALPLLGQNDNVSIRLDAPENVIAGEKFEVTLTFEKGDLEDYSRFSQDIPSGFTAENITSPNADFTFTDQRVRIIWLKLPAEPTVEVKYGITPHERISGKLELEGTFAYVSDGERAYLNVPEPRIVNVMPNPDIDPSLIVDVSEFNTLEKPENIVPVQEGAPGAFASIVRQKPIVESNGIVYVNLLVQTPGGTNYMKIEEILPSGYSFESLDAGGAVVSQSASLARYVWMNPQSGAVILVRYRLVPILEQEQEAININGTLTYTEDGISKEVAVQEETVNLEAMNLSQQSEYLKSGTVPENLAAVGTVTRPPVNTEATKEPEVQSKPPTTSSRPEKTSYTRSQDGGTIDIPMLQEEQGVYFRIQVAAVRNPYFARTYFSQYDLLRDIKVEKIGGWSKYTVGSFFSYEEAKMQEDLIESETPVKSAFVVAYRNGSRIPLSEAR